MNILLSAYACEPNKGSEPGVGWSWAIELAKTNNVWVLTKDNNKPTIENYLKNNVNAQNDKLHFIYIGLPKIMTFWKKGRRGMRLYYMLWQKKAYKIARDLKKSIKFDYVQHVTFVSYTQPTYMYKLNIPFVFGPISGGENIPKSIKINMSLKERVLEIVRKLSQKLAILLPSIKKSMKTAKIILAATNETKSVIPSKYQYKTRLMPAIGLNHVENIKVGKTGKFKIIMAGRLINWKAFDIGIKAFLKIVDKNPNMELHILGEGNQKSKLKKLSGKYLDNKIFFEEKVEHDNIYKFYKNYDLFVNTTLRDSGCMTMMEAMSVGLPCIALSVGGPKILLDKFNECNIAPISYEFCVDKLAALMLDLSNDSNKLNKLSAEQYDYANQNFMVSNKISQIKYYLGCKEISHE